MDFHRYFIHLAFDGSQYHGWQVQPNAITVQSELENALSMLLKQTITVLGCGRTDAGVSALNFFAQFEIEMKLTNEELHNLAYRLNKFLKQDIVIYKTFEVSSDFHARFTPISRVYQYSIITEKDPFLYNQSLLINQKIDIGKMLECLPLLIGTRDFQCFSKVHTQVNNFICTITNAHFIINNHHIIFEIQANRFLRNMVRAVVGTLLEVGLDKIDIKDFENILNSKNRCNAGESVPSKGLKLTQVLFPENNFGLPTLSDN